VTFNDVSKRALTRAVCAAVAVILSTAPPARAVVPMGIRPQSVGAGPYCFDSAEQHDIRVDVLARGLSHPYSLVFLPNADALLVERGTRLRLIRNVTCATPLLVQTSITGVPNSTNTQHAGPDDVLGIQDVAIHPDFSKNHFVYYTFNRVVGFDAQSTQLRTKIVLVRARLEGSQLVDSKDLLTGEVSHDFGGSRLLFGQGNLLYVAVGGISKGDLDAAQRTDNLYGKVLRVHDDGTIPADNPFARTPGAR